MTGRGSISKISRMGKISKTSKISPPVLTSYPGLLGPHPPISRRRDEDGPETVTPAERIKFIEEAAEPLAEMPRERMQLVLRQHGVKTWDTYDDGYDGMTTLAYCYDRLEEADDQTLKALHAYLVGGGTLDHQRGADDLW